MPLTVEPDFDPVPVPPSRVQTAPVRSHPATAASATEYAVPTGTGNAPVSPDPVTDLLMLPGFTVKLNCVESLGVALLTIFKKPPPGVTMQSFGSLLPPFPADGKEHTL